MKKIILSLVVLCIAITTVNAQIRITEVNPVNNTVKIKNVGTMMTNVSSFVLCDNAGNYPTVMSVNSPMNLMGNQEVTLNLMMSSISLSAMSGNIALYSNSSNYMMTANMADFFQWGAGSGGRESVAVMKGIWMMGAFVMTPGIYTFTGTGMEMGNRMPFWQNGMGMGGGNGMMMDISHIDELLFAGRMDGTQVGVTTNATGLGSFLLNDTRDTICYEINVNGLSGAITAIHLHNAPAGQNGGVVIDLTPDVNGNTIKGIITGTDLSNNLMNFFKEELYINLHTAANAGGELRGQVKLETDMMFKGMLSDEAHVHNVNLTGMNPSGLITFGVSQDKKTVNFMVVADSLTGPIQLATFMYGQEGLVGAMAYNETMNIMMGMPIVKGSIDISANPNFVDSLMAGAVYVNLTTMMNPNGELRGQLSMDKNTMALDIMLDTAQVMGSTVTGANPMGVGLVSLNYSFDTLKYDVMVWGLSGTMTNIMLMDATDMDNMIGIKNLNAEISGENRITGMITGSSLTDNIINLALKGDICFRIQTAMNPGGEVAGHITKFARDGFVYSMDGSQVAQNPTTSVASGLGIISMNRTWMDAHYMFNVNGLGSGFASAKFRLGAMGETGMMEKDMTTNVTTNGNGLFGGGFWKSTDMTLPFMPMIGTHFVEDSIYIEINTVMQATGEIRGQTKFNIDCGNIATGIEDELNVLEDVAVYPNPTKGNVTVNIDLFSLEEINIQIYNAVGQVVINANKVGNIGKNSFTFNLVEMPNGIYYVNANTSKESITTKLILLK